MSYDAKATRRNILKAAATEFARHGLAGARVDRIAAAAGSSKERMYAHFGGKETLFRIVLNQTFEELTAVLNDIAAQSVDDLAVAIFEHLAAHPENERLLAWARLEDAYDWSASRETILEARSTAIRRLDQLGTSSAAAAWSLDDMFVLILALANTWLALPGAAALDNAPPRAHQVRIIRAVTAQLFNEQPRLSSGTSAAGV